MLMKAKIIFGIALAATMTVGSGCSIQINTGKDGDSSVNVTKRDNSPAVTKTVKIGDFEKVYVSNGIAVSFTQAANPGTATVRVSEKYADKIEVYTGQNTLVARLKPNTSLNSATQPVVTVSSPMLKNIDASSGGGFIAEGDFVSQNSLTLEFSSGAAIRLNGVACPQISVSGSSGAGFTCKSLKGDADVDLSSSADANIYSMTGRNLSVSASSGADFHGVGITVEYLSAYASSGADISVKELDTKQSNLSASSGGDVSISGKCGDVRKSESSGGDVKVRNK